MPDTILSDYPSVAWQQHVLEHWWEGSSSPAILPTSASVVMVKHCKMGGIALGAATV